MDTRFDALVPRASVASVPAPTPRPAEQPWAQAWAHEWQQATAGQGQPPAGGDLRVAWRDASATSTWLAPVRPRADAGVAEASLAQPQDAPAPEVETETAPQPGRKAVRLEHGLAHAALPTLGFMAATPQVVPTTLATPFTEAPGLAATVDSDGITPATPAMTLAPAGPGVPAATLVTDGSRPTAPTRAASSAAPRSAPPARTGESQPFAPTNLQVTAGDDGPAVWLRDARLAPDGQTAARLLQALATLGWTQSLRPGALFLNGRRLADLSERLPTAATTAREATRPALPDPITSPKEDSHGH